MRTPVLSSAQLSHSPGSLPDTLQVQVRCPPTPTPSVSPFTAFPTLYNGLFTHALLHLYNFNESRDLICFIDIGSLGHSMVPGAQ